MGNGKKNYFRHSFSARNDVKIRHLINKFGKEAYYFFFVIVELCAEEAASELKEGYIFHASRLRLELGLSQTRLNLVLEEMQTRLLLVYTCFENEYEINMPNLSKYMGKYSTKTDSNAPKERKEKKRKEKKSKEKETKEIITVGEHTISPLKIFESWNNKVEENNNTLSEAKSFSDKRKSLIKTIVQDFKEMRTIQDWDNYFDEVHKSPFLTGNNDRGWTADFDWILNKNNFIKIIEGRYGKKQKKLVNPFL